jgi:hypothetical protein
LCVKLALEEFLFGFVARTDAEQFFRFAAEIVGIWANNLEALLQPFDALGVPIAN